MHRVVSGITVIRCNTTPPVESGKMRTLADSIPVVGETAIYQQLQQGTRLHRRISGCEGDRCVAMCNSKPVTASASSDGAVEYPPDASGGAQEDALLHFLAKGLITDFAP